MKFYHWFIPNKKNKFHPIALRTTGLIVFLVLFIAIPLSYNVITANQFRVLGYATNININDLFTLSNQERANNGLSSLNLDSALNSAALAKANDMIADNYWAHVAPDGTTPWSFILVSGYQYTSAGENLAKDFNTSSGVVAGWMGSPSHRENVLNSAYIDVGYAVVNGILQGSETSLVVAMYGVRSAPYIASTEPAPSQAQPQVVESAPVQSTTPQQTVAPQTETETTTEPEVVTAPVAKVESQTQKTNNQDEVGVVNNIGNVAGSAISLPIKIYNSFNWGQKASILLGFTLILLFIMKHTLIWREQKRGLKHIWLRAHPLGQVIILVTVLVATIASGAGVVL